MKKIEKIILEQSGEEIYIPQMINTTWEELKALRDAGKLIAGEQYRITDYVATTVDPESRSANHPFDIIVTADSESVLNEDARAIAHEGDTYFEKCNLAAWQLRYCLDNDVERFTWAQQAFNGYQVIIDGMALNTELVSSEDTTHAGYPYRLFYDFQGIPMIIYSNTLESDDTLVWMNVGGGEDMEFPIAIHGVKTDDGKGIIYYLKDEYNNESCYDFKGIQFRRYKSNVVGEDIKFCTKDIYDITCTEEYEYFYLFSTLLDNDIIDESVQFYFDRIAVYNNKIFTRTNTEEYPLHLPHIVSYTDLYNSVFRTFIRNSIITGYTGTLYGFNSNIIIEDCENFFISSESHYSNIKQCDNFVLNNNTRFVNMCNCSELRIKKDSFGYLDIFILGGVKGNILITQKGSSDVNTRFAYFVAKNSQEEIKIFNPADIV